MTIAFRRVVHRIQFLHPSVTHNALCVRAHTRMTSPMHTPTRVMVHPPTHASNNPFINSFIHSCTHTYVHARMHACMCRCARLNTYTRKQIDKYLPAAFSLHVLRCCACVACAKGIARKEAAGEKPGKVQIREDEDEHAKYVAIRSTLHLL